MKGINRKTIGFSWDRILCVFILLEFSSSSKENIAPITNLPLFILKPVNSSDTFIYQEQGCFGCMAAGVDSAAALMKSSFVIADFAFYPVNSVIKRYLERFVIWSCTVYEKVQKASPIFLPGRICLGAMQIDRFNSGAKEASSCDGWPRRTIQKPLCKTSCVLMAWDLAWKPHPGPWIYPNK